MFHEFGHALHGILSNCQYNSLSGTSVARDFVEMPSQFNESFASIPEVFDHYARHWETGEPMPAELKERMLKSINFQSAYSLGENLAATCLDLAWHMLPAKDIPTAEQAAQFETEALRQIGLLDSQILPLRCRLLQLSLDRGSGCEYRRCLRPARAFEARDGSGDAG